MIDVEKIYKIDNSGNVDVERSWILTNRTRQDVDISKLSFYVGETVEDLVTPEAKDSSGSLDVRQEKRGSTIELEISPRINTLSSHQKYKMTLLYQFPNNVHKLGDVWFFSDLISGMNTSAFSKLISEKMDLELRVILPKLKKRFWQNVFYESNPKCKELAKGEKGSQHFGNTILEWTSSLFSDGIRRVELVYGVKTNIILTTFLTFLATVFIAELIKYAFDILKGGG